MESPTADTDPDSTPETNPDDYPLKDTELIIYTLDIEKSLSQPETELAQEHGLASVSLWARDTDQNTEFPLWMQNQDGDFISYEIRTNTDESPVSNNFIRCLAALQTDTEDANWGNPPRDLFESLTPAEQHIVTQLRDALFLHGPKEALMILAWASKQIETGEVSAHA